MASPSLRPVPLRPPGPVAPEDALRCVTDMLPGLDEGARRALALVELGGVPRSGIAAELGLSGPALAAALARARKALRRSMFPLSASGWCERAERLISDRLDGELGEPGRARLEAHLENCDRCVEHERRLDQAREALVRRFIELHPAPEPEPEPPPPELRVVEQAPERAAPPRPEPAKSKQRPAGDPNPAWKAMYALAVLLAVLTALLTVLGATGVLERVF
jgi:putative zinc finger protein/sigma-70-like protein